MIEQASQCNGVTVSWIDTDNVHWTKLVKIRPELEMIKKTSQRNDLNPHHPMWHRRKRLIKIKLKLEMIEKASQMM